MASVTFDTDLGPLTITEKARNHYYRRNPNAHDTTAEIERSVRWDATIRVQHPSKKAMWDIYIPTQEDGTVKDNATYRSSNYRGVEVEHGEGWTYLRSNWRAREREIKEVVEPLLKAYVGSEQRKALVRETVIDYMRAEIQHELDTCVSAHKESENARREAHRLQAQLDAYTEGGQTDGNV